MSGTGLYLVQRARQRAVGAILNRRAIDNELVVIVARCHINKYLSASNDKFLRRTVDELSLRLLIDLGDDDATFLTVANCEVNIESVGAIVVTIVILNIVKGSSDGVHKTCPVFSRDIDTVTHYGSYIIGLGSFECY